MSLLLLPLRGQQFDTSRFISLTVDPGEKIARLRVNGGSAEAPVLVELVCRCELMAVVVAGTRISGDTHTSGHEAMAEALANLDLASPLA